MLEDATRDRIARTYAALRAAGLSNRPTQRHMIAAMAHALTADQQGGLTLVEAPTGTGKTLAYLLAGIEASRQTGRKLIVSTATLALQEQILHHDIPQLVRAMQEPVQVTLAKSRRWYACDRNLMEAGRGAGQGALWEEAGLPHLARADAQALAAMAAARADGSWDGDLSTWPDPVPDTVRRVVTTGPGGCPGRRCPYAGACPSLRSRAQIGSAQILITNHAYLLADMHAPQGASLVTDPAKAIVVFDEGHNLPRAARQAMTARVAPARLAAAWDSLAAIARAGQSAGQVPVAGLLEDCAQLRGMTGRLAGVVATLGAAGDAARLLTAEETEACAKEAMQIRPILQRVATAAANMAEHLSKAADGPPARAAMASQLLDRLGRQQETLGALSAVCDRLLEDSTRLARWLEHDGEGVGVLATANLDTAATLGGLLGALGASALVSATLRRLGSFAALEADVGRRADAMLALPSAFDLAAQGELRVAIRAPAPADMQAHTAAVVSAIVEHHAPGEGTLVLFASHRQMSEVAAHAQVKLPSVTIRVQGDADLAGTLAAHAGDVEKGRSAMLMGTASFAEGLDLPGALCRALIIAKLPFACPDEPIERARALDCEAQGGNAFRDITLPDAHLRLTQAIGRLIRTETDHGWVVIADTRLAGTRYGRTLLAHLPPFRRADITLEPALGLTPVTRKPTWKATLKRRKGAPAKANTKTHGRHDPQDRTQPANAPATAGKRKPGTRDLFLGYTTSGGARLAR